MRMRYDLTGATTVVRDLPLYIAGSAGTVAGQALATCLDDATEGNGCVVAATGTTAVNMIGVAAEAVSDGTSVMATGVSFYQKTIINPNAVWCAEAGSENGTVGQETAGSAAGKVTTDTFSANNLGGWIYVEGPAGNSGIGNLSKIGALSTTASVTAATSYDDNLGATTTDSLFILLPSTLGGGVAAGTVDLNTACTKVNAIPAPTGAAIMSLENYITSPSNGFEPLRVEQHSGKRIPNAKFYVDLVFTNSVMLGNAVD